VYDLKRLWKKTSADSKLRCYLVTRYATSFLRGRMSALQIPSIPNDTLGAITAGMRYCVGSEAYKKIEPVADPVGYEVGPKLKVRVDRRVNESQIL
jgi:hypothetical protein